MSKYIKLYPTKANATSDANAVAPHVSYCEEVNQMIYMAGAPDTPIEIKEEGGKLVPYIKVADAVVGDWLFSDLTWGSEIGSKTPIGLCVAPKSHFSDGKARYMSLVNMSLTDPEHGTTATGNDESNPGAGIRWGKYGDVEGLTYIEYSNSLKTDSSAVTLENPWGFVEELDPSLTNSTFPGDFDHGLQDSNYPFVNNKWFYYNPVCGNPTSICPYMFNADGSRNTLCNQEGKSTGDLNGKANTDLIMAQQVLPWQSGAISNEVSGDLNFPAACCCRRFNAGVNSLSGQWYLPASGEAAYMWANINMFNTKLSTLGSNAVCMGMGNSSTYSTDSLGSNLWSSSEYGSLNAWDLDTHNGYLYYGYGNGKEYGYAYQRVRAFFAL